MPLSTETSSDTGQEPTVRSATRRLLLRAAGIMSLALGALGVIIPGLPTTPFVLVAAACFARSSPRLHQWLLANRVFGPLIRDWQERKTVSLRTKITAITTIVIVGVVTLTWIVTHPHARLALGLTMAAVAIWLGRVPTHRLPEVPGGRSGNA